MNLRPSSSATITEIIWMQHLFKLHKLWKTAQTVKNCTACDNLHRQWKTAQTVNNCTYCSFAHTARISKSVWPMCYNCTNCITCPKCPKYVTCTKYCTNNSNIIKNCTNNQTAAQTNCTNAQTWPKTDQIPESAQSAQTATIKKQVDCSRWKVPNGKSRPLLKEK